MKKFHLLSILTLTLLIFASCGDEVVTPEKQLDFTINPNVLDFGVEHTEKSFSIVLSDSTEKLSWSILENKNYISFDYYVGTGNQVITARINRNLINYGSFTDSIKYKINAIKFDKNGQLQKVDSIKYLTIKAIRKASYIENLDLAFSSSNTRAMEFMNKPSYSLYSTHKVLTFDSGVVEKNINLACQISNNDNSNFNPSFASKFIAGTSIFDLSPMQFSYINPNTYTPTTGYISTVTNSNNNIPFDGITNHSFEAIKESIVSVREVSFNTDLYQVTTGIGLNLTWDSTQANDDSITVEITALADKSFKISKTVNDNARKINFTNFQLGKVKLAGSRGYVRIIRFRYKIDDINKRIISSQSEAIYRVELN
jgi:hypothetical protein